MTAPFAPVLVSPGLRGSANAAAVNLTFRYWAFSPGDAMGSYKIRRKQLSPTPGAYEYWNGTIWTTEGWVTLAAGDGTEVTIQTGAWATNAVWEWGVATRNAALEASAWSSVGLIYTHAIPALTVSIASPSLDSRPTFNWAFSGGTGRSQSSYDFVVYTEAETQKAGFQPGTGGYAALWTQGPLFSGRASSTRIEADLASSGTYKLYSNVTDDTGLSSGWGLAATFTTNFSPPTPPSVSVDLLEDLGLVRLLLSASDNLLDSETSSFFNTAGTWEAYTSASFSWYAPMEALMTFTGATYAELDSAHTDFTAEDAAYGTFANMEAARVTATSEARTAIGLAGIPVVASTVHSATVSVQPQNQRLDVKLSILWYNASGVYMSASNGSIVSCGVGGKTNVFIDSATSPVGAAYAALALLVDTPENVIGQSARISGAALSATSQATWTPGGSSTGVGYVVQRRVDGGDWEYLWNATHDSPYGGQGAGDDRTEIYDGELPLGNKTVEYQVFAVTEFLSSPKFSVPTVVTLPGGMPLQKQFLRSRTDSSLDMRARVTELTTGDDLHNDILLAAGASWPKVFNQNLPRNLTVDLSIMLLSEQERLLVEALIATKENLFLQRNIGLGLLLRPTGKVTYSQIRSRGAGGLPQDVHRVRLQATVLA